jgi:metallo-beta-lactamase family protein
MIAPMGMSLRFLGATGTVTGSRYLVRAGGRQLLVDCGLFQGYKQLRLRNWAEPPFDPAKLDAVVLTHAHIDHSGYLPVLARRGFRGKVHCSEATRDLCRILLPDSAHLQEEQAAHANRHGYSRHAPALPLYTGRDAARALKLFAPVRFGREFSPVPGLTARLDPAGHILGAAIVSLRAGKRTLVLSGDLGRPDDAVMGAPSAIGHADVLVMESTYGDRLHEPGDPAAELGRVVAATAARGGVVIIPAFAVGRTQALLHFLHELKASGAIPRALPVYLDSPMAAEVTRSYVRHASEHRLTPAQCEALSRAAEHVATPEASRRLGESSWPMVIVAGSGMATGGRVLHHLKRFAPDARNTILFAGFQAGGTRGEAMVHGATEVKIHGEAVAVRAQVSNLDQLSAHADANQLVDWLAGFRQAPGRIFLTHGEPAASDALRKRIKERLGWEAEVPEHLQSERLWR